MKKTNLIFATACALAISTPALAEDIVIATGTAGMTYERWGNALAGILGSEHNVSVETSAGSMENVQRCGGGNGAYEPAHFCFAQGDIIAMPEFAALKTKYRIVKSVGEECLYVAYNTEGSVTEEDDLQTKHDGKAPKIVLGEAESGTAGTWTYITTLDDGYKAARPMYDDSELALGDLEVKAVDAVAWMTSSTNLQNPILQQVLATKGLDIMNFNDWSLNDELPNGDPVYEIKKVDIAKGLLNDTEVNVPCTQAYLLMSKDTPKPLQKQVTRTLRTSDGIFQ